MTAMVEWSAERGEFCFGAGGKHPGKSLREVAESDPNYLTWVWGNPEILGSLSETAWGALQDIMEQHKVPFERTRASRR
jgi:hypothetical protein